jgi:SAM-dependent methyltransferase
VQYDPTYYSGSAPYYTAGRPPYSRQLPAILSEMVPLDGRGRLLDVGTGPGTLAVLLAPLCETVISVDPDAAMLTEGQRNASAAGVANIQWVCERAERIGGLALGAFRLVTFGQSFQWTEREMVAEIVYDLLQPRGVLALISHFHQGRPIPNGPGHPPIPHDAIRAIMERFLGPGRRAGQGPAIARTTRHEEVLSRTRFGTPACVCAPGRPDIVQDADGVIANYLSMSFCAPHLFGNRLEEFRAAVRRELESQSTSGLFWDWPGDTEILIARRLS